MTLVGNGEKLRSVILCYYGENACLDFTADARISNNEIFSSKFPLRSL